VAGVHLLLLFRLLLVVVRHLHFILLIVEEGAKLPVEEVHVA
jgi:hypothetical protein